LAYAVKTHMLFTAERSFSETSSERIKKSYHVFL